MCIFLPCCCGLAGGLALLRCILNSAARKMWVCVWGGRVVVVGGNLSCFCLLPANLRGGRVVTRPLEVLLPVGNVVSGVYIVYAFFYFLPAGLPAGVCVWRKSVRI